MLDARTYMLGLSKAREVPAQWQRACELLLAEADVAQFSRAVELALFYGAKLDMAAMAQETILNPLTWKREHQVALICAAALGGLFGAIFGLYYLNPNRHFEVCIGGSGYTCWGGRYLPLGYLLLLVFWIALGGLIGAAVVYIRQLLRA